MLPTHQSRRAIATFLFSVLLALAAGGVCIAFGVGAPLAPAHTVATQAEPVTGQSSHQDAATELEPVLPSSAGT